MNEDSNKEFIKFQDELLRILNSDNYWTDLLTWINDRNKSGLTKKDIYLILLELFKDIQTRPDPGDFLYDRLSEFLDGFTSWGKSFRILPGEPDIEPSNNK
jgi:hypothetical protein